MGKLGFNFQGPPGKEPLPLRFVRTERGGARLDQPIEVQSGDHIHRSAPCSGYANSTIRGVVDPNIIVAGRASVTLNGKPREFGDLDSRGQFVLSYLPAGEYKLLVVVRDANGKSQNIEKQVTLNDDAVTEITIDLANPT